MEPGRPEGMFGDYPAWRENDEIDVRRALDRAWCGEHGVDRWVRMIEGNCIHAVKIFQIVFVRRIVAVPCHDIKRRVVNLSDPEIAEKFADDRKTALTVFICGNRI